MDQYSALIQLVTNGEATTWNRFYNFLMGNSILILAWATVYVGANNLPLDNLILISISVFGVLSSPFWAALGSRGRKFLNEFNKMAAAIENDDKLWTVDYSLYKPFNKVLELRESLPWKKAGSYYLIISIPWGFTMLYLILLIASIMR